jgi:hypothetical protein
VHLTADPNRVPDRQIVVGRFVPYRFKKNISQFIVSRTRPQRTFDIFMVVGQQTGPELSACRQPQAIASITKVMAQCMDKSDFTFGAFKTISLSRAVIA